MDEFQILVPASAYPYLVAQRGALDDMRDDQELWCQKYSEVLMSEFESIEPYLPKTCETILDVGGGMGGIDILLNRHYGGKVQVAILDGLADAPNMVKHRHTFSNYEIARNFLAINGVQRTFAIDPAAPVAPYFFDLVISLKSWCFHYEPETYLSFVKAASIAEKTKIIIDVRGGARIDHLGLDWQRQLCAAFGHPLRIHYGMKFDTMCYTA